MSKYFKVFFLLVVVLFLSIPARAENLKEKVESLEAQLRQTREQLDVLKEKNNQLEIKNAKLAAVGEYSDAQKLQEQIKTMQVNLDECSDGLWRQRAILDKWDACYPSAASEGVGGKTPCEK